MRPTWKHPDMRLPQHHTWPGWTVVNKRFEWQSFLSRNKTLTRDTLVRPGSDHSVIAIHLCLADQAFPSKLRRTAIGNHRASDRRPNFRAGRLVRRPRSTHKG